MNLKEDGYKKLNISEDIVNCLFAEFHHQANMVNSAPSEDPASPITSTVEFLQQFLDQNQELMQLISTKDGKSVRKKTNRPPTPSAGNCHENDVTIFNSNKTPVLNGTSNTSDVLWDVAIETSRHKPPLTANSNYHTISVHHLNKKKPELSSYLHAAAVCPTKSTLIQAINK